MRFLKSELKLPEPSMEAQRVLWITDLKLRNTGVKNLLLEGKGGVEITSLIANDSYVLWLRIEFEWFQ